MTQLIDMIYMIGPSPDVLYKGHAEDLDLGYGLLGRQGDRVGQHDTVDRRLLDSLHGRATEDAVRGRQIDLPRSGGVHYFGCAANRAGRPVASANMEGISAEVLVVNIVCGGHSLWN